MREVPTMSPARRSKLIASGREFRLSFVSVITDDATAIDLVARIPADLEDISEIAQQLVSLGLRSSRKRAGAPYIEFIGSSDEAAVRAIVEPVGGCVMVIASPTSAFKASGGSHASEGALPADETGATTFVAGEPSVHGGIGSDAEERDATSIDERPAAEGTAAPEVKAEDEDQHLPPPTVLGALGVPEREDRPWPTRSTGYSGSQPVRPRLPPFVRTSGSEIPEIADETRNGETGVGMPPVNGAQSSADGAAS